MPHRRSGVLWSRGRAPGQFCFNLLCGGTLSSDLKIALGYKRLRNIPVSDGERRSKIVAAIHAKVIRVQSQLFWLPSVSVDSWQRICQREEFEIGFPREDAESGFLERLYVYLWLSTAMVDWKDSTVDSYSRYFVLARLQRAATDTCKAATHSEQTNSLEHTSTASGWNWPTPPPAMTFLKRKMLTFYAVKVARTGM
ncbi:hypothetical protein DFH09DRAFT_1075841 [Mycena vulgaris]|nr:hypothetical protein DFH09DRAFT_1075841 [Mycena vulgaris]